MSYFEEVYKKRLNRYGTTYQTRIQGKREHEFELLWMKSTYQVDFDYENEKHPGCIERYKQDETETVQYLLTRVDLDMPNGTILMIPNKNGEEKPWMIWYLEEIKRSGYNRYIMLKMTHLITWTARDGENYSSWVYMYGQENNMLKDEIRSRSRMDTLYSENLKLSFFVMPTTPKIRKDDYLIIGEGELQEQYRVTGYDIQSSKGVEYVSVDPIYEYDSSPKPEQTEEDDEEEFFWLNGGVD